MEAVDGRRDFDEALAEGIEQAVKDTDATEKIPDQIGR